MARPPRVTRLLLFLALGCKKSAALPTVPLELHLERALSIEIADDFEPSGLALWGERILTVSDKHDAAVYEIVLGNENATLRTFVSFAAPPDATPPLDFEGMALDTDGALLLASEAHLRVLRVTTSGTTWITPSLGAVGGRAGLLRQHNAGIEGIARLRNGRLLLAAEREPRGLLELPADAAETSSETHVWAMADSIYPLPPGRKPDFADLTTSDGEVYALERNSHLIVRLERTAERWEEREAWSYAKIENDPRFSYRDTRYGVAEGLAMDREHVYLATDNNRVARTSDADDRRPQLFVFSRPR